MIMSGSSEALLGRQHKPSDCRIICPDGQIPLVTLKSFIQSSSRSFYVRKAVLGVMRNESTVFRLQGVAFFLYLR